MVDYEIETGVLKILHIHIAGVPSEVLLHPTPGAEALGKELGLYPAATKKAVVSYAFVSHQQFMHYRRQWDEQVWLIVKKNSLIAILRNKEILKVFFCIVPHRNLVFKTGQRWLSNQFTIREEYIGQIFHENVLLPAMTCLSDVLLIHGAAFNFRNNTFLIGGKGGVGKTSIELKVCFHRNASFIADDMAIVYKGQLSPNLSYPKIYRYNLVGETELRQKLFLSFSWLSKLHWYLYPVLFRKEPRIRINPLQHYRIGDGGQMQYYIIVSRINKEGVFAYNPMNIKDAAELTCTIMQHELKPFQLSEAYFSNYQMLFNKVLSHAEIIHLQVSKSLPHQAYMKQMEQLIVKFSEKQNSS